MKSIAIVGANGLVGEKLTEIIADKLPDCRILLFGNSSVGRRKQVGARFATIQSCDKLLTQPLNYALFAATNEISQKYVPKLAEKGVICIDNSSQFRLRKDVPLVVPSINGDEIANCNVIANPNCSTIQVVLAVNALKCLQPYKMTAVTYQAASGAGKEGANDLAERRGYGELKCFEHPVYDNVIPCIGNVLKSGYTSEEQKLVDESRKILNLPLLKVNGFCARIPVSTGHSIFVNLQLKQKFTVEQVRALLNGAKNVLLFDDAENGVYPMPIMMRHTKYAGVGRIVKDRTGNGVNFVVVADNLLRGAAYNAYEILQRVMDDGR